MQEFFAMTVFFIDIFRILFYYIYIKKDLRGFMQDVCKELKAAISAFS